MRNLGTPSVKVPDNPVYVDFLRSDGNQNTWPSNTTQAIDSDGHVNWMDTIPTDHTTAINWRLKVAWAIAADMGIDGGDDCILRSWPTGYRMYDHNKGPAGGPRHDIYLFGSVGKRFRSVNEFIPHAIWLMRDETLSPQNCVCKYCSKKAQKDITAAMSSILRTANSQSPTPSRSNNQSALKKRDLYTKLQKELKSKREKEQQPKVYAAIQKALKPLKSSLNVSTYPMLVERNSDLRAVYSKSADGDGVMTLRKWFRENEIVWCALNQGIRVPGEQDVKIAFWPGVVEQSTLKSVSMPIADPSTSSGSWNVPINGSRAGPSASNSISSLSQPFPPPTDIADQDERGTVIEPTEDETPLPWAIKQSTTYRIRLLAVSTVLTIADEQVLPYQAHAPPNELIIALQAVPPSGLNFDKETIAEFNPCKCAKDMEELISKAGDVGGLQRMKFYEAAAAYAFAVQIAATVSGYWSLTDEWKFKYVVSGSALGNGLTHNHIANDSASASDSISTANPPPHTRPHLSLHSAIEAASRHNAQASAQALSASYNPTHFDVSSTNPEMPEAEVRELATRVLGVPMHRGSQSASSNSNFVNNTNGNDSHNTVLIQTRYQGMWWGAERIWVDDFIRLKVQRGSFAPKGAPNILPPAPPSARTKVLWAETYSKDYQGELDPIGAWTRGVFMRLDGLMVVDVPKGEGGRTRKEGRACGVLYELVEEDWEEGGGGIDSNGPSGVKDNGKGKGKEREVDASFSFDATLNGILPSSSSVSRSGSTPNVFNNQNTALPPQTQTQKPRKSLQPSPPSPYLLPQAPKGYRFRPILSPGYEVVVNMALISGRYYPRILSHPLLHETVQTAVYSPLGYNQYQQFDNLWALEGLAAGYCNTMDPVVYKKSRVAMVQDADREAAEQLEIHKEDRIKDEANEVGSIYMDGPGDGDVRMESDEGSADELQLHYPNIDMDIDP